MKARTRLAVACMLLCVLAMATACPPSNDVVKNMAVAAKDSSIIVREFQTAEMQSFQAGAISLEDHIQIQQYLLTIATVGKTLDSQLRNASTNQSALLALEQAVAALDALQKEGLLGIKSPDAKQKWALMMVGVRTSLATLIAVLQPPQQAPN